MATSLVRESVDRVRAHLTSQHPARLSAKAIAGSLALTDNVVRRALDVLEYHGEIDWSQEHAAGKRGLPPRVYFTVSK
jgi:predicted ArsR family transcriptional regulator